MTGMTRFFILDSAKFISHSQKFDNFTLQCWQIHHKGRSLRVLSILCAFIFALSAEQFSGFLESVYDEISALNLSQKQQSALTESIKNHHNFLRKWYANMRANNEQMLGKFAESTLKSGAAEFARGEQLANERIRAEYEFMMSVYEILDGKQRKAFGAKLKGRHK